MGFENLCSRNVHQVYRFTYHDRDCRTICRYKFTLTEAGKVTPRFPLLNDRMYESEMESQFLMLCDSNKVTMFWSLELILISQNSKGMSCSLLVWLAAAGSIIWGCVPKQCETHKRRLHSYITYQVLKFALHSYSNHPIQLGDNRLIWSYF